MRMLSVGMVLLAWVMTVTWLPNPQQVMAAPVLLLAAFASMSLLLTTRRIRRDAADP